MENKNKVYKKKCLNCKERFTPQRSSQVVCSPSCAYEYAKSDKARKSEKKAWKRRKAKMSEEVMSLSEHKKLLEKEINTIVRILDDFQPCMMCGTKIEKQFACHYHAVEANDTLRFNLYNIWGGCYSCNGKKGGNIIGYDEKLIKTYGRYKWEYIKFDLVREYPAIKLTVPEIKEARQKAKKIIKELEVKKYSIAERWAYRELINNEIGIY